MKKQPFQDSVLNPDQLQANMRQARAEAEQNVTEDSDAAGRRRRGHGRPKKSMRAMSRS